MSMAAPTLVIGEGRFEAASPNAEKHMTIWPDHRLLDLLGIELPIILAPMAGGLGSLACALLGPDQARVEFAVIRQGTSRPINMNFFCHAIPAIDAAREDAWLQRLRPYFVESPSARTDRATDRGSADDAQRSFHGKGSDNERPI
jgi:hypothetical protein